MLFRLRIEVEHFDKNTQKWSGFRFVHPVRAVSRKHALDKALTVGRQTEFATTLIAKGVEPTVEATILDGPIQMKEFVRG